MSLSVRLRFGLSGDFSTELESSRVSLIHPGPTGHADVSALLTRALSSPLDMPPLEQAVVPGDKVVLTLDRDVPNAAEIVAAVWQRLVERQIEAADVTVLQPAAIGLNRPVDPRAGLPGDVAAQVKWKIHDPTSETSCCYLATTAAGERIYLASELVEADFVLPIGCTAFDPLQGYRSATSSLYPGLSTVDAMKAIVGLGHSELTPGEQRPLKQKVDEIAWLMGLQYGIQVVPGVDGLQDVASGSIEGVAAHCRERHDDHWLVRSPSRVETVVVAIPNDAGGHGWFQLGRALAAARQLVSKTGRIIVLSELTELPGEAVQCLRQFETARDALKPIRMLAAVDLQPATQLADAASWARIYLLSRLPEDLVEALFMFPLETPREVGKLLERAKSVAFLGAAQHSFCQLD